jgi:hypothetical protein
MKIVFVILLNIFSLNLFANYNCKTSVNPTKVVLFVNTNYSHGEADKAAHAACERGETFKMIPAEAISKEFERKEVALKNAWNAFDKNCSFPLNPACHKKSQDLNQQTNNLDKEKKSAEVNPTKLNQLLVGFASKNIAVTSMVISGHDGGGNIHGALGEVNKFDIIDAMKGSYKNKPNLLAQFNSVFMWGCWTMGPSEVSIWKDNLPSLKMCSGFYDMGPLNTTEASQTVLHDLLVKEKSIVGSSEEAKVKNLISQVQNINQTWAAVYAEAKCGKNMYFYRTQGQSFSLDPNEDAGTHFVNFDKSFDCHKAEEDLKNVRAEFQKYFSGAVPVPADTRTSPLRQIYAFVRSHSHCIKANDLLNGDRILMMVFQKAVNENFAKVFQKELASAATEFKNLDALLKSNPLPAKYKELKAYFDTKKGSFSLDHFPQKSRAEVSKMISFLDGLKKQKVVISEPALQTKMQSLRSIQTGLEKYLYNLDPYCMNALEWHEVKAGEKPEAYCPIK